MNDHGTSGVPLKTSDPCEYTRHLLRQAARSIALGGCGSSPPCTNSAWPEPGEIAQILFTTVSETRGTLPGQWAIQWSTLGSEIENLLIEIEMSSGLCGRASRIRDMLFDLIQAEADRDVITLGDTLCIRMDAMNIPLTLPLPLDVRSQQISLCWKGMQLGTLRGTFTTEIANFSAEVRHALGKRLWETLFRRDVNSGCANVEPGLYFHASEHAKGRSPLGLISRLYFSLCVTRALERAHLTLGSQQTQSASASYFQTLYDFVSDPWRYENQYEQIKYDQALSLLDGVTARALELGCAEGMFTARLASRAREVLAIDVSNTALKRAAEHCERAGSSGVTFQQRDVFCDMVEGTFDLVVCSEILYFLGTSKSLSRFLSNLVEHIVPGGHLLIAHGIVSGESPNGTGFDWKDCFGANTISDVCEETPFLRLQREIKTPLYRIQLYQRLSPSVTLNVTPRVEIASRYGLPPAEIAGDIVWNEPQPPPLLPVPETMLAPFLSYPVVGISYPDCSDECIGQAQLDAQMKCLAEAGFRSLTASEWHDASLNGTPIQGRAFVLIFVGQPDFRAFVWPVLQKYGFKATVLLPAQFGELGDTSQLTWNDIRGLAHDGVEFGFQWEPTPSAVSLRSVRDRAVATQTLMQRELGTHPIVFAYSGAIEHWTVARTLSSAAYKLGLSSRSGVASLNGDRLSVPQIKIHGGLSLSQFVLKLAW